MGRVKFNIQDFPKFLEWTHKNDTLYWIIDFELAGFHSAENHQGGNMSLNEEEYTWFVLKWT